MFPAYYGCLSAPAASRVGRSTRAGDSQLVGFGEIVVDEYDVPVPLSPLRADAWCHQTVQKRVTQQF
jgi:hypothetical protein